MTRYVCVELFGTGDPMFGGAADDRALGHVGAFLTGCYDSRTAVATFPSKAEALAAGERAPNRREGAILGSWERA